MAIDLQAVKNQIRDFIVREYLPGEDPSNLADDMPLRTSGILDSMSTLALVSYVEKTWSIEVAPHEASDSFDSINDIAALVGQKA